MYQNNEENYLTKKCGYCDNYNRWDSEKCYVCEGYLNEAKNEKKINIFNDHDIKSIKAIGVDEMLCKECFFPNKIGDRNCYVCNAQISDIPVYDPLVATKHESLDDAHWKCPSCTLVNSLDNKCCSVCFTFQQSNDSESLIDENIDSLSLTQECENTWICGTCNVENPYSKYMCGSCKKYAPFFHKWVCRKCSYFNADWLKNCEVCNERCYVDKEKMVTEYETPQVYWDDVENVSTDDCVRCGNKLNAHDIAVCQSCSNKRWYCCNKFCATVMYKDCKFCNNCSLRKGCNVTDYNMVDVFQNGGFVKMRQCSDCGQFCVNNHCKKCDRNLDIPVIAKISAVKDEVMKYFKGWFG